jgi:very-short-patch-repair endonuclease
MVHSRIINVAKQSFGANNSIKTNARELRKNMTDSEKILWSRIRKRQLNGKHFRRQHPYGIYILDFYCFESQLVIEIDGMIHLKRNQYDQERTVYLESTGLKVLCFKNVDIEERIDWVLKRIMSHLIPPLDDLNTE